MANDDLDGDASGARLADDAATIAVDVALGLAPRRVLTAAVRLPPRSTVADALRAAGWAELAAARLGDAALGAAGWSTAVWGRARALSHALRDGDRVEVVRALAMTPAQARRARYRAAGGVKALRERAAKVREA
ncbi:MAG: RnfH family protein [Burkholderiaceae bacterium]